MYNKSFQVIELGSCRFLVILLKSSPDSNEKADKSSNTAALLSSIEMSLFIYFHVQWL